MFIKILIATFFLFAVAWAILFFQDGSVAINNQCTSPVRTYESNSSFNLDSLKAIYSENKTFVDKYETQSIIALSYFPQVKNCDISFVYANINTTLACRPVIKSLFRGQRKYQIFINDYQDFEGVLLQDVPFNAQIGVIGHEITHILDYEARNLPGIIQCGINYLSTDGKQKYERMIDSLTVMQGLGWQLYDWADFSMYKSTKATEDYKRFKRSVYMSPAEIEKLIQQTACCLTVDIDRLHKTFLR